MGEPKQPGTEPEMDDFDAPATAEEIAGAKRLSESLLCGGTGADLDASFALSLRAAWAPDALSPGEVEELWEGPSTTDEVTLASALCRALDSDREPDSLAPQSAWIARAFRAAWAPSDLDGTLHRRILRSALVDRSALPPPQRFGLRRYMVARNALMGGLALAASVMLVLFQDTESEVTLARTRSTQPLFGEPFRSGEASARVDRIAAARISDFRDNRFAAWGIR